MRKINFTSLSVVGLPAQAVETVKNTLLGQLDGILRVNYSLNVGAESSGTLCRVELQANTPVEYFDPYHLLLTLYKMALSVVAEFTGDDLDKVAVTAICFDQSLPATGHPNVEFRVGNERFLEETPLAPPAPKMEKFLLHEIVGVGFGTVAYAALDGLLVEQSPYKDSESDQPSFLASIDAWRQEVSATFSRHWVIKNPYGWARRMLEAMIEAYPQNRWYEPRKLILKISDANYPSADGNPTHEVVIVEGEPYDITWVRFMVTDRYDDSMQAELLRIIAGHLAPGLSDPIRISHKATRRYESRPGYQYVVFEVADVSKSSMAGAKALAKALLARILELDPVLDTENIGVENLEVRHAVVGGWDFDHEASKHFIPDGVAAHRINVPADEEEAVA